MEFQDLDFMRATEEEYGCLNMKVEVYIRGSKHLRWRIYIHIVIYIFFVFIFIKY